MVEPETYLFNDLDEDEAQKWAAELTASPIMATRLSNRDVYGSLPCTYLVLEGDRTLPKDYQEGMVAGQVSKPGIPFTMYYSPAGHSLHLSWTQGVVQVIREFAESVGCS